MSKEQEMQTLRAEAARVQQELQTTVVESEFSGMVVTVNGNLRIDKVEFEKDLLVSKLSPKEQKALAIAFEKAVNKGLNAIQATTEEKMKPVIEGFERLSGQ